MFDQREREDWQEHCHEFGHAWVTWARRDAWTGVTECRHCGARVVEDIPYEEETA